MNAKFDIKSNVIQLMAEPNGITDKEGHIVKTLALSAQGVLIRVPAEIFPFLRVGTAVLVTLSVVQIQPEQPLIEQPKLII